MIRNTLWPFFSIVLCLLPINDVSSQCADGRCNGGSCSTPGLNWDYQWRFGKDQDQVHLFLNGSQVGTFRYDLSEYFPLFEGKWGASARCPVYPPLDPLAATRWREKDDCHCPSCCKCKRPCKCKDGKAKKEVKEEEKKEEAKVENFGVESDKIRTGEHYRLNGKEVSKDEALAAIAGPIEVPDDSQFLRLTIIGSDAERQRVLNDLATDPVLKSNKSHLVIQDYAPDHWAVQCGFVTKGNPTIYLQKPDGTVLHRQDDYDGPDGLATALRKTNPTNDPKNDPDLRKTLSTDLSQFPPGFWIAGGFAAILLLKGNGKNGH